MRLGMNWGMSQSRLVGITDNVKMHHFQSLYQPRRLRWVLNYKAKARWWYTPQFVPYASCVFFFFQSLRLLRGTAFTVTRVNIVLTLRVWIDCGSGAIILFSNMKKKHEKKVEKRQCFLAEAIVNVFIKMRYHKYDFKKLFNLETFDRSHVHGERASKAHTLW